MRAGGDGFTPLPATPFSSEIIELIAERAISENWASTGHRSARRRFLGNDYVGHAYGPDSRKRTRRLRTDKLFDKFFRYLERKWGCRTCWWS
jgi:hypothetical protein